MKLSFALLALASAGPHIRGTDCENKCYTYSHESYKKCVNEGGSEEKCKYLMKEQYNSERLWLGLFIQGLKYAWVLESASKKVVKILPRLFEWLRRWPRNSVEDLLEVLLARTNATATPRNPTRSASMKAVLRTNVVITWKSSTTRDGFEIFLAQVHLKRK